MDRTRPLPSVWALSLLAVGCAANLYLMCGTALVAFAVVATITLGLRRGMLVALGVWFESQCLGFSMFGYPHTLMTGAWGLAIGAGTALAAAVAARCAARGAGVAFVAAFTAYESALAAFALASGGGLAAFAPATIAQLLISNVALALGLSVLHRCAVLATAGVATAFGRVRNT